MQQAIITPDDIVREARNLIGVPWLHQGLNPQFGIDCRGMLLAIADALGYQIKDYTRTYRKRSPAVELRVALADEFDMYWQRETTSQPEIQREQVALSDVVLIKFPRDIEARHVGVIAEGLYELTIIHAYEPLYGGGKVQKEPFRRWQPCVMAAYKWKI